MSLRLRSGTQYGIRRRYAKIPESGLQQANMTWWKGIQAESL
jgi:hypothetical protein